jgi:hypothetical protein
MAQHLIDRYGDRLHGVLSCYDRIVVTGTLPQVCYAAGMTAYLYTRGIRIVVSRTRSLATGRFWSRRFTALSSSR